MKGLMIIASGFEDNEALTTLDILKRSKLIIDAATVNNDKKVISQSGLNLVFEKSINDISLDDYDFLIIPGGGAVNKTLVKLKEVEIIINHFVMKNQLVACICAAPLLVGRLGHFKNEKYTCFPGCNEIITGGTYLKNRGVVVSNNFITAKAMAYSIDFSLAIIEYLQGKSQKELIARSIKGE